MFQPFDATGDIRSDISSLVDALRALSDPDSHATLANAASLLNWYLQDINWVGFYLWNEEQRELILGPFQGLPACLRISPGRGVCGKAFAENRIFAVDDVTAFPGHIACDSASRSELVVPIRRRDGSVLGVLDIDSPSVSRFCEAESAAMEQFADVLAGLLSEPS